MRQGFYKPRPSFCSRVKRLLRNSLSDRWGGPQFSKRVMNGPNIKSIQVGPPMELVKMVTHPGPSHPKSENAGLLKNFEHGGLGLDNDFKAQLK